MNEHGFDVRSGFCLALVVALHVAIVFALYLKDDVIPRPLSVTHYLQYVAIIPPISQLKTVPSDTNQSRLNKKSFASSTSLIEPPTEAKSAQPNALPKLNLDVLRSDAVRYELSRPRSSIELEQEKNRQNQSLEARLEKETKKATRADCRDAYAHTGLFAPLFITADLLSDRGCKF